MAANLLYASLYLPSVTRLDLHDLPASHMQGPAYLNVLRHLDLPQAVALAAERRPRRPLPTRGQVRSLPRQSRRGYRPRKEGFFRAKEHGRGVICQLCFPAFVHCEEGQRRGNPAVA